jgi:hypothetical protein
MKYAKIKVLNIYLEDRNMQLEKMIGAMLTLLYTRMCPVSLSNKI